MALFDFSQYPQREPLGFMDTIAQNRNALVGLGFGLMAGTRQDPFGSALQGYQTGAANDASALYRRHLMQQAQRNEAYRRERDKAEDAFRRQQLEREPESIRTMRSLGIDPASEEGRQLVYGKQEPEVIRSMRAVGIDPNSPEGRQLIMNKVQPQAPAGYEWSVSPETGQRTLSAIEGGPATKLPAESAGRLALMDAAMPGVEEAKKYFLNPQQKGPLILEAAGSEGAGSGLYGMGKAAIGQATGSFEIGRQRRSVRIAIEAALRAATGAAAPEAEVDRYTDMYAPSVYDTLDTRKQKLESLDRFLKSYREIIVKGHVPASRPSGAGAADPLGIR